MISQDQIDQTLRDLFRDLSFTVEPAGLYDPLRYMIQIGGKRLRPRLCLTVYSLFHDAFPPEVLGPAAALEVYHTFTLIHDDMMDRSSKRRGCETVWKKWSPDTAILSGDVMCIDSFRRVAQAPPFVLQEALDLFSTTAAQVCEGQQYDMEFESRDSVSMHEYLKMIGLKTAVLLACSARMGALVAGAPAEICQGMYDYGYNLGMAFQVADDYLDAYGDEAVFGKPIGGDILNTKKSWLTVRAAERKAPGLPEAMALPAATDQEKALKIARVKAIYDAAGIADAARETIRSYHEKALAAAERVTGISGFAVLKSLADSLLDRAF